MTRQTKTPAQRAQEAYDLAVRIEERLAEKLQSATEEVARLEREHADADRRRAHAATHPDLPPLKPTPSKSGDTA